MSNITDKQRSRLNNLDCNIERLGDFSRDIPVSEALDWIRDYKSILCHIDMMFYKKTYKYFGRFLTRDNDIWSWIETARLKTHPLAESALLDAVLDYLEKK